MGTFVLVRLAQSVLALFLLSIVVFVLGRATGDPTHLLVAPDATEEQRLEVREALGLDEPLHVQYGIYMNGLLHGDMGTSLRSKENVATLILDRLPASAMLALAAMTFIIGAGIPLGVLSAVRRGTYVDTLARAIAIVGQSAPAFLVGIVLMQVFAVNLGLFPTSGSGSFFHLVLPALTLGLFVLAGIVRLLRASMLEVLDAEYVKLARTKGLSESEVVWKHAFRNALIPVVTFAGFNFSILLTLAIVVEVVFAWPGVGRLTYTAIIFRDFPVLQGIVLVTAAIVMAVNFLVDILYGVIDPRIRIVGAEAR